MNPYTVVFNHPDDNRLACIHIDTLETRYVHLMFFGKLANDWGYGWDDMKFGQPTDLGLSYGRIMIHDRPLHYQILNGHYEPDDEAAMTTGIACG